jgi:hypothetical protein
MPKRGNCRCGGADCAGNGFNEATSLMEDGFRYIVDSWDAVYKIDVRSLCARPNHAGRAARLIAERLIVSPVSAASSANIVQRRLQFHVERARSEAASVHRA